MIKIDSLNEKVYCEVLGDVNIACLKTSRRVLWGLTPRDVSYGDKTRAASFLQCLINERECFIGVYKPRGEAEWPLDSIKHDLRVY